MKRRNLSLAIILVVIFLIIIVAVICILVPTPTPNPTPIPPTPKAGEFGHFVGYSPEVSFDYTEQGIENFKLTTPFGQSSCTLPIDKILHVDGSGNFTQEYLNAKVNGRIQGNTAWGTFSITLCVVSSGKAEGSWTAERTGP